MTGSHHATRTRTQQKSTPAMYKWEFYPAQITVYAGQKKTTAVKYNRANDGHF